MGIIENFKKLGYRFTSTQQKPKMTNREALREIHTLLCSVETDEPLIVRQKFEKINVNQYTDEQVKRILKGVKSVADEYAKSQKK